MKMHRVLIVDDNQDNRYFLRALLEGHGFEVVTATQGADALDKARQHPPDLVVADILMPVMDGFALCREWKKDGRLKAIPFVFYSATYTDERDRKFALSLGADRFIVKPEEPDAFLAIIRDIIRQVASQPAARTKPAADVPVRHPMEAPDQEEAVCLKQYNEALIRKLEAKMEQLEQAKRELEQELEERKRAEAELRQATSLLKNTFEAITDLVTVHDRNLRVVLSNWHGRDYVAEEERRAMPHCYTCYMHRDKPCELCPTLEVFRTGRAVRREVANSFTGKILEVSASPVFDNSGELELVTEHVHDITARKQAEALLTHERDLLHALMDSVPDKIYFKDRDSRFVRINRAHADSLGLTDPSQAVGKTDFDVHPPDAAAEAFQDEKRILDTGQPLLGKIEKSDPANGEVKCNLVTKVPIKDDQGQVVGLVGISRDISAYMRAEEALRESEERFRQVAENAGEWIWEVDAQGLYVYSSPVVEQILGYKPEELVSKVHFPDLLAPEVRSEHEAAASDVFSHKKPFGPLLKSVVRKNGTIAVMETNGAPILDQAGNVLGYRGINKDITERTQAEQALLASEERFAKAFRSNPNAMAISTLEEGRYLEVNDSFVRVIGHQREDALGRTALELGIWVNSEDRVRIGDELREAGRLSGREVLIRTRSGQIRVNLFSAETIEVHGIRCLLSVLEDITEQKRAAEALRESARQLAQAMDLALLAHWEFDVASGIFTFNDRFYALYGTTAEREGGYEMSAETYAREFLPPEEAPSVSAKIAKALATTDPNTSWQLDHHIRRRDGEIRHIVVRISVIKDSQGRTIKTRGANQDVTDRKRAEEELSLKTALLEAESETTIDGILIVDEVGHILLSNRQFSEMWNVPEELLRTKRDATLVEHSLAQLKDPDAFVERVNYLYAHKTEKARDEVEFKDGRVFDRYSSPLHDSKGRHHVRIWYFRDITERKRAEAENARLVAAIEQSEEAVVITDTQGNIEYVNPAFTRYTGYSREEVLGQNPRILKSGKQDAALYQELWATILKGESWHGKVINRRKDGGLYTEEMSISPVRNPHGEVTHFIATKQDVTRREQIEEHLRQVQKIEAVGRLAGGVAHDFNNLLTIIFGYGQLLRESVGPKERGPVEEILKASDRAASLTRQLLAFSRRQLLTPQVLDLNSVVANLENMLRRLIREDIELTTVPQPGLWHIKADPGQIEQVIMNLVVNARDAVPDGGKITIETANADLDETYARGHFPMTAGSYVSLTVRDTGSGMDKETQTHIFEPFFTTKKIGKGTGLGLATVYGIVKQSSGYIWVRSEPGQGSTFEVYLPRVEEAVRKAGPAQAPEPKYGSETVLLVEDEEAVRSLVRAVLGSKGYKVLEAAGPNQALSILEQSAQTIHLLLTDVVMPQMNGRDLAKRVVATHPEAKVLYMSGYADDAIVRHGIFEAGTPFLQKPFSPTALVRKVREVLDSNLADQR